MLASRAYERDYLGTAAALERYKPEQLISFAARLDTGPEGEDFAAAARRLDQLPDEAFIRLGVREADVTAPRERFAAWPRQAEARREQFAEPEAGLQEPAGHEAGNAPHMAVRDDAEPEAEI